jgi:predicted metal-dependent hydrolase
VELNYLLVKSRNRKKTISLQLRKDGVIVIQAPCGVPRSEIDRFFKSKHDWIHRKIGEKEEVRADSGPREFFPGETFLFLGFSYPLIVDDANNSRDPLNFSGRQFILKSDYVRHARDLFIQWYKDKAREHIEERTRHYSLILDLQPRHVRIGNAVSRWASCSYHNHLSFTWRLIMAPGPVIDYVVVHELVHIKEKNHSQRFWNLLEKTVPDYESQRLWLKKRGYLLDF